MGLAEGEREATVLLAMEDLLEGLAAFVGAAEGVLEWAGTRGPTLGAKDGSRVGRLLRLKVGEWLGLREGLIERPMAVWRRTGRRP